MGDPKQVKAVIQSIKEYSNFRQMASYNMSCLMTYITPPTVGWRENVAAAVEDNGIESIITVLSKHGDSLETIKHATTALSGLVISKENAGRVAQQGGIETAVKCMLSLKGRNEDEMEVIDSGAKLMENVARYNPESILKSPNALKSMLQGINHDVPRVQTASAKVLDRVATFDEGLDAIVKLGGIKAIISSMSPDKPTHDGMLRPLFRILERLARNPEFVKEIRRNKGVEALVAQLERHADNEYILRAGGRLLAKIADADIESAIEQLKSKTLSDSAKQHLVGLLANLALQPQNVDKIVENGGIEALLKNFDSYNNQTKAAALRALQRIAASGPKNADRVIQAGGLATIINALKNANGDEDILKAATQALTSIVANGSEQANMVHEAGGVEAVVQQLRANAKLEGFTTSALDFIEKVSGVGFSSEILVKLGVLDSIFAAMHAGIRNPEVQERGFEALSAMLSSNDDKSNAMVANQIGSHPQLSILTTSLMEHKAEKDVVKSAVNTLSKLVLSEAEKLKGVGALRALIESVFEQMKREMLRIGFGRLSTDVNYTRNVKTLLATLVDKKRVASVPKALSKSNEKLLVVKQVAVFAVHGDFANVLQSKGVSSFLEKSISSSEVDLIAEHAVAAWSLGKSGLELLNELVESGCVKSLLSAAKSNSKHVEATTGVCRGLVVFASSKEQKKTLLEMGIVECCVTVLRANVQSNVVCEAAVDLLLSLASTDEAASQVCYRGGTRQTDKMILDSSSSTEFEKAVESGLKLLYRVASVNKNDVREQLVTQGTIKAATVAMSAYPTNSEILDHGAKILSLLLTEADVSNLVDDVIRLTDQLSTSKRPERIFPELGQKVATIGYVSFNPANKVILTKKNAKQVVGRAIGVSSKHPLTTFRENAVRNEYRALGQLSSVLGCDKGLVDKLLKNLQAPDTVISLREKVGILEAITYLSEDNDALKELLRKNAVQIVSHKLRENRSDELFLQASLDCLAALMRTKEGVDAAAKCGAGELIFGVLRDDAEHLSSNAACSALKGLTRFCAQNADNSSRLEKEGAVDVVASTISQQCLKGIHPEVVEGSARFLNALTSSFDVSQQIVQQGALKEILETSESSPDYLTNDPCMMSVIELLDTLSDNKELIPKLRELKAVDLVMQAMNLNPGNEALEKCGQRVLQKLIGGDADALEDALKDYDKRLNAVRKDKNNAVLPLRNLNRAQQNLRNLLMVTGAVDAKGADMIMSRAIDTYEVVEKKDNKVGPIKEQVLDSALDTIGKMTLIDGAMKVIDVDKALNVLNKATFHESPELQFQALTAIGTMLNEDKSVVKSAIDLGMVQRLEELTNSADPNVKKAAEKALDKIRDQVIKDPSLILIDSDANDLALTALIKGVHDPKDLQTFLQRIGQSEFGPEALIRLGLFGGEHNGVSPEMRQAILQALGEIPPGNLKLSPLAIEKILKDLNDPKSELSAEEKALMLKLLQNVDLDPQNVKLLTDQGAVASLLKLMQNDPDSVLDCLNVLSHFAKNPELANQILELNGDQLTVEMMKKQQGDAKIQEAGFELLVNLKESAGGPEKFVLSPDSMLYLDQALNGLDPNRRARAAQLIDELNNLYNGEVEPMVISRFDNMLEVLNAAKDWRTYFDPETGKYYYHNKATNETVWQKPQAMIAAENALRQLEELAKKSPAEIDNEKLRQAIGLFAADASAPLKLQALAKALAALAANEANRDAMVKHGVLNALVRALNGDKLDRDFILAAIALLNQFAKHPVYKEMICKIGGVLALIKIMVRFMKDEEIVEKCEQCLTNLAFESKLCTKEIMKQKGPEAVGHAMKTHKDSIQVNLNAMGLLANLMFDNLDNKKRIGDVLRDRVVALLRRMYKENNVLKQTCRVLGNIAFIDDHIRRVVSLQAVKSLVVAMDHHKTDLEVLKLGIKVLSNFASVNEEEFEQEIKVGKLVSVISTIWHEGGAKKIVDTFHSTNDLELIASCIKTLRHLLEDVDVRRKLIGMNVVQLLFNTLQKYADDIQISSFCVDSFELLSFSVEGVESLYENDGVSALLQQLDLHASRTDLSQVVCLTLTNMCNLREPNRDLSVRVLNDLAQQGGIDTVLSSLESHVSDAKFVKICMRLLTLLTAFRSDVSRSIAQQGMRVILQAVTAHEEAPEVLKAAYQLLGLLAFEQRNLKVIVQYGGINLIVKSVLRFPENDSLVKRSIKTLDNIAMASPEHSNIVNQARGKDVIKELIRTYETIPGDKAQDVVRSCKAALLSLSKVETRQVKRKLFFTNNREEVDVLADPLKTHRELLRTGAELIMWKGGSKRTVHLLVKEGSMAVHWKVPGGKKVLGKIELKNLVSVTKGLMPGHGKSVEPRTAFALVSTEAKKPFCFQCAHEVDRNRWHEALDALKQVFRNQNHKFLHL